MTGKRGSGGRIAVARAARRRLHPGSNRAQQERRKVRMIGGLRCRIARRRRGFGTADRRHPRRRRTARRGECRDRGLRLLRCGTAAAATATPRLALTARLAAATRAFA